MPSVVAFNKNGERLVGQIAKRQMVLNPESTIHSVKRFIGRPFASALEDIPLVSYTINATESGDCGIEVHGRSYSPQEISAMVLQKCRRSAEDFLGEAIQEAVITVPAYFTDRQRQATRDAGIIAGLDVLRIVNEPTAAALAYLHGQERESTIAVFDFGGGTFDLSILDVANDLADVRGTRGNATLGGADLDWKIVEWLIERFHAEHGMDLSDDRAALQRLRDAAERAKIELSSTLETEIHLPFLVADASGPKHLQCSLSRAKFETLTSGLLDQTIDECRNCLQETGVKVEDIDEVIMVGGSSRIPAVQERVKELFQQPLNKSFNPDEVVAIGAAVQAGILEGDVKAVTLLDVTNFSLGIEVEGRKFATLIPKNTHIPTQRTQLVSTVTDNQKVVRIHILQGEEEEAHQNTSLGEFELRGIAPAKRGEPRIEVKFLIDSNGMVIVSAKDAHSGEVQDLTIHAPTSLTKDRVLELREEAAGRYRPDAQVAAVPTGKNELEAAFGALQGAMAQAGSLDPGVEEAAKDLLIRARTALEDPKDQDLSALADECRRQVTTLMGL
jgi:molecular chaperone DnaK